MSIHHINNTHLRALTAGDGEPLVLVHGNWADSSSWGAVIPALAEQFQVVAYDRRGYSASGRHPEPVLERRFHEDDLAELIESLDRGPAHIVGSSYGGLIALGVAARRADLVASASVHEPPAVSVADGTELTELVTSVTATLAHVIDDVRSGEIEAGTRRFMEEIALGAGTWEQLPPELRRTFMDNAGAVAKELEDPAWSAVDLDGLACFPGEIVVTRGDVSPRWFRLLAERLTDVIPGAAAAVFAGAGHAPHMTHAADFADYVTHHARAATAA